VLSGTRAIPSVPRLRQVAFFLFDYLFKQVQVVWRRSTSETWLAVHLSVVTDAILLRGTFPPFLSLFPSCSEDGADEGATLDKAVFIPLTTRVDCLGMEAFRGLRGIGWMADLWFGYRAAFSGLLVGAAVKRCLKVWVLGSGHGEVVGGMTAKGRVCSDVALVALFVGGAFGW
jgi:hypothetical protein